jgi:hypothetical protein
VVFKVAHALVHEIDEVRLVGARDLVIDLLEVQLDLVVLLATVLSQILRQGRWS